MADIQVPLINGQKIEGPFIILKSLIVGNVSSGLIPGFTIRLRNIALILTLAALTLSSFETYRFSTEKGPLPKSDWSLSWVIIMLVGSISSLLGTTLL